MFKKSFVIFFVIIFICCMISTVAFAQVDYSDINTTVDYLKAETYFVRGLGDGNLDITAFSSTPIIDSISLFYSNNGLYQSFHYSEFDSISISWSPTVASPVSKLIFYFTQNPNATSIYINGTSYPLNYSDQVASYSSYYISFARPTIVYEVSLTFNAPSNNNSTTFTSPPGIISAFGFNVFSEDFSSAVVNAYNYLWNYDTDDLMNVDKDYFLVDQTITAGINTGSVSYLNDFYHQGATGVLLTTVDITIDLQSIGPDFLNYFKFDYSLLGEIRELSAWVGSDHLDGHEYLTSIPVNNIYSDSSTFEFAFEDAEIHTVDAGNYSLYINLNGIDLKPYRYLNITITFEPVDSDRDYGTLSFLNLNRLTGFYSIAYDSSESIILSTLSGLLLNSKNMYSALIAIQEYFTVDEDQKNEIANSTGELTDQSNQLKEGIAQLEQVDRPEINLDSLLGQTGLEFGVMPTNILSVITNNKYIFPLLLASFVLSLAAYLLFGRR